ncbi:MAG: hypothetical protein Q4D57_00960, partial [Clostridia bacterium]|nr:hypothetical protein [Clostridia bacterium]
MFISSSKTTQAKKKLEEIKSAEANGKEVNGKQLLKNFLEHELKEKFITKNSAQAIIKAAKEPDSNVYKFATLLNITNNMILFKKAIELQAKSLGTNAKKGLFNKFIFPIKDNWLNSKSKIKTFLLAEKDNDISDGEIEANDKKSRRMKNMNIAEKLKSKRLSNVLKVFMALVMWDYIRIK